jgi:riboflavin kinase/FMN adenylyltransferase
MNVININISSRQEHVSAPSAATIGFFDGVHAGHQYLVSRVIAEAKCRGLQSTVITFDRHPRQVLQSDYVPRLLTTLDEKLKLLERTGIDNVAVLHFDKEMAAMSARQFMKTVLNERLSVALLMIGYDNRFGHNSSETFADYVKYGRETGIEVLHGEAFSSDGRRISSSMVRRLLQEGDVAEARICLNRPYKLTGTVVKGLNIGHKIGFPTANISLGNSGLLAPRAGVYVVSVDVEGTEKKLFGMMNVGPRPTFGISEPTLEVNIFDFKEDIYGRKISVDFLERLRDDEKFDGVSALTAQLNADRHRATDIINKENIDNLNK